MGRPCGFVITTRSHTLPRNSKSAAARAAAAAEAPVVIPDLSLDFSISFKNILPPWNLRKIMPKIENAPFHLNLRGFLWRLKQPLHPGFPAKFTVMYRQAGLLASVSLLPRLPG
jgi:hypothetical protein